MKNTQDFILKIRFLTTAIFAALFIIFLIRFFSLNSVMVKVETSATFFLSKNNPILSIERINIWYNSLNKFLKIKSCFFNSFIKKLIFSTFGHDLMIVCGVKLNEKSKIEGHAWLCYEGRAVFEDEESLRGYTESFRV